MEFDGFPIIWREYGYGDSALLENRTAEIDGWFLWLGTYIQEAVSWVWSQCAERSLKNTNFKMACGSPCGGYRMLRAGYLIVWPSQNQIVLFSRLANSRFWKTVDQITPKIAATGYRWFISTLRKYYSYLWACFPEKRAGTPWNPTLLLAKNRKVFESRDF